MTDIASVKKKIQIEETQYRSAVSESTAQKMGGTVNWIIDNSAFAVGDIVTSMLTEAQFQAQRNNSWVLMNGQPCIGSDYEALTGNSSVPDMINGQRFLRQAAADNATGVLQADENKSHNHGGSSLAFYTKVAPGDPGFDGITAGNGTINIYRQYVEAGGNSGGDETRPKNLWVNFFIKINNEAN